jgi:hypothetical protein
MSTDQNANGAAVLTTGEIPRENLHPQESIDMYLQKDGGNVIIGKGHSQDLDLLWAEKMEGGEDVVAEVKGVTAEGEQRAVEAFARKRRSKNWTRR